jgi:hypothetical protein
VGACSPSREPVSPSPTRLLSGSNQRSPTAFPGPKAPRRLVVSQAPFRLPEPLQREVAASNGGSVLVAGGLDSAGSSTDGLILIDRSSGAVRRIGTMPSAFHDAAGTIIGGRLFVFGGGQAAGTDVVQSIGVSGSGGAVAGRLPSPVSDLGAAMAGSTVVLVGGYDGTAYQRTVFATSNGTAFRSVATLPVGLRYAAVAAVGRSVIVAGGLSPGGLVRTVLSIDAHTGSVRRLSPLPQPLAHATAVAIGGRVYVFGGEDSVGRTVASVERIDPRTGAITVLPPLPSSVADAAGVATGPDAALLLGGRRSPQGNDTPLATILRLRLVSAQH